MKSKIAIMLILPMVLFGQATGWAAAEAVVARDMEVDVALLAAAAPSGVLPPTAGTQAAAGVLQGTGIVRSGQGGAIVRKPFKRSADTTDHKAQVIDLVGTAKIVKKSTGKMEKLAKGTIVEEGDQIITQHGSSVSVGYDDFFLNVIRIDADTKATFRTIEPTDVFLEDGSVFSIVENLRPGEQLKVSTPVAVTAVRGTRFVNEFNSQNNDFFVGNIPVPDERDSFVSVTGTGDDGGRAGLTEGNQIDLDGGAPLSPDQIEDLSQDWIDRTNDFLDELENNIPNFSQVRNAAKSGADPFSAFLPATGGGGAPAAGAGGSNTGAELDPQLDTGVVGDDTVPGSIETSESHDSLISRLGSELSSFLQDQLNEFLDFEEDLAEERDDVEQDLADREQQIEDNRQHAIGIEEGLFDNFEQEQKQENDNFSQFSGDGHDFFENRWDGVGDDLRDATDELEGGLFNEEFDRDEFFDNAFEENSQAFEEFIETEGSNLNNTQLNAIDDAFDDIEQDLEVVCPTVIDEFLENEEEFSHDDLIAAKMEAFNEVTWEAFEDAEEIFDNEQANEFDSAFERHQDNLNEIEDDFDNRQDIFEGERQEELDALDQNEALRRDNFAHEQFHELENFAYGQHEEHVEWHEENGPEPFDLGECGSEGGCPLVAEEE